MEPGVRRGPLRQMRVRHFGRVTLLTNPSCNPLVAPLAPVAPSNKVRAPRCNDPLKERPMSTIFRIAEITARSGHGGPGVRIAAGLVLAACLAIATASFRADKPPSNPVGAAVSVVKASRACFKDAVEVTGALVPREEVLVRPDREGLQISKVFVEAGQTVKTGQLLARLAPPEGQPGG